jgi:hypothetical protein
VNTDLLLGCVSHSAEGGILDIVGNFPFRRLFLLSLLIATLWVHSPVQAEAQLIPQAQLQVVGADSEQSSYYRAARSIDGKTNTMWHTRWSPTVAPLPHQITLKLSAPYKVTGLRYLPRQDGGRNGIITAYAIYVSTDGVTWGPAVASGTWEGNATLKEVTFPETQGTHVRLVATAAANRWPYTSAAEINILGSPVPAPPPIPAPTTKHLTWVDSSNDEDGFKIERKVGATGTFVRLAVVGVNTTAYADADTVSGTVYCYRVQAFNAAGHSPYSNEACSTNTSTAGFTSAPVTNQLNNTNTPQSGAVGSSPPSSSNTPQSGGIRRTQAAQLGVFRPGTATWYLDRNANGQFDDCTTDTCATAFGVVDDLPVIGDWGGTDIDQIGVFNSATQMWDLDKNNNRIWEACSIDKCYGPFGNSEDLPVSGRWRIGSKVATIGVYRPQTGQWFLDLNGNGRLDGDSGDAVLGPFGTPADLPVVGDWTGAGQTRIGTFSSRTGEWRLDLNGNGLFDGCVVDRCVASFGRRKKYPVVGDWTGNGTTQIGVFNPSSGIWHLDLNNDGVFNGCEVDRCAGPFGQSGDLPMVGRW